MKLILSLKSFNHNRHQPDKPGFTLVELIMTIVVVGILVIPLSLLVSGHFTSLNISGDLTTASNLARSEMEKVNNLAYDDIRDFYNYTYEGYNYSLNRTVDASLGSLKKITVVVTKSGRPEELVSLVTYIANVTYGP